MHAEILTEVVEGLKNLAHEDPNEVVSRKQDEDKEQVKKMSQDFSGKGCCGNLRVGDISDENQEGVYYF